MTGVKKDEKIVKVSDYVVDFLVKQGVEEVFGFTGGVIAPQLHAFYGRKDIKFIPMQHEQAAAMAADGYARIHKSGLGVTMVTSGPGATNLLTGVCCSFYDSIPTLHFTGQVATNDMKKPDAGRSLRQVGFQETDIVSMMKAATKYSVLIGEPQNIRYELEKAVSMAKSGRPGPVHIDYPINIQLSEVKGELAGYKDREKTTPLLSRKTLGQVLKMIRSARRPVLIGGAGIRLANAEKDFRGLVERLKWPVLLSWAFADALPEDNHHRIGLLGVYGGRGPNFAVQNSDLILAIGTRLDSRMTGSRLESFARSAKKIVVDIASGELNKGRIRIDLPILADAKHFISELNLALNTDFRFKDISDWQARCLVWKNKYPNVRPEYYQTKGSINPYVFSEVLSEELSAGKVIVADIGSNLAWMMQSFKFKNNQRLFTAFGHAPMGYSLPAAIGASIALGKKPVICTTGDGGFQINIQELQTIINLNLPIKIFIFSNCGYSMIRQFQEQYLDGVYVGSCEKTPDFVRVAKAYGIPAKRINNQKNLKQKIRKILNLEGPFVCEIIVSPDARLLPKTAFRRPIEESDPPLSKKEFKSNMVIPIWKEKKQAS